MQSAVSDDQKAILLPLLAYAAGDAFGVAYEYLPVRIAVDIGSIGARGDWPVGSVSDDTLLSLITIHAIQPGDPKNSAEIFHSDVLAALPTLRGLGPTTRAALGLAPASDEGLVVVGNTVPGNTNGGMMRTALLGLGYPEDRDQERRAMVVAMTQVTHKSPAAVACAVACSALFSRALSPDPELVEETLGREFQQLDLMSSDLSRWPESLTSWVPPARGIALDPLETLAAVVWVAARARTTLDALRLACELGGDTDTVSALAAALVTARHKGDDVLRISWIDEVKWDEVPDLLAAAMQLAALRRLP
jgi:ADP-ribosyl-[dinitrogen reductase] hydrolase